MIHSNNGKVFRETYKIVGTNAAAIAAAGGELIIEEKTNAQLHGNLPHNAFVIANTSTSCTLYIFLDDWTDRTKPDYVLFPSQQISVSFEEGAYFSHLMVRNTHAATEVAIAELKYRIMTVKQVG